MAYAISKVDVWAGDIRNRPGSVARVLESLANTGANLELVVARRVTENTSRVFVAPLKGGKQFAAAADVGLIKAAGMVCIRMEGPDRPGMGAQLCRALAAADINIRGITSASQGKKFLCYFAFASEADAAKARKALKKAVARQ